MGLLGRVAALVLLVLLATVAPATAASQWPSPGGGAAPLVAAHRGGKISAGITENSLAAFDLGFSHGADAAELDFRLTSDDKFLVMHDAGLARTTNCTGFVHLRTARWVKRNCRLDDGQRVPFSSDVLSRYGSGSGLLMLELKNSSANPWRAADLARMAVAVDAAGLRDRVMFTSFHKPTLLRLQAVSPAQLASWIIKAWPSDGAAAFTGLDAVSAYPDVVTQAHADEARAAGLRFNMAIADAPADWDTARALGLDSVVTDEVDQIVAHYGG